MPQTSKPKRSSAPRPHEPELVCTLRVRVAYARVRARVRERAYARVRVRASRARPPARASKLFQFPDRRLILCGDPPPVLNEIGAAILRGEGDYGGWGALATTYPQPQAANN